MVAREVRRIAGEDLAVVRVLSGEDLRPAADARQGRGARLGLPVNLRTERYWAGRDFAGRNSARLAA